MQNRNQTFVSVLAAAFVLVTLSGCGLNDYSRLIAEVKKTPAEQWHRFATLMIERSKTNSAPVQSSEVPAFVRRITKNIAATNWQLAVETNGIPYVRLYSLGGFQSIGVDIYSSSFMETNSLGTTTGITKIYPGVYVCRSL